MATTSVVPDLIDALLDKLSALPALQGVLIVDGPDVVGDDADKMLFVGMADPRGVGTDDNAGDLTQEWPNATAQSRAEKGSIHCVAMAFDGSGEGAMKAAREAAFAIVAEVQALLWADVRLGVDGVTKTSFATSSWDQRMTDRGAMCAVLFSIDFDSILQRSAS